MELLNAFLLEYPLFKERPVPEVEAALRRAIRDCPLHVWSDDADDGRKLLAAHYLQLTTLELARTTAIASAAQAATPSVPTVSFESGLKLTVYGQQFETLKNSLGTPGIFV